jgi:caa(3)-type oxidase subunit IV
MDTAVDTHAAGSGDDHAHADHGDARYWRIAGALAIITGLEVWLSYLHIGKAYVPVLLTLMVVKFLTVVSEFMHLRLDNRIFKFLFYGGLVLAIVIYVAALLMFRVFNS